MKMIQSYRKNNQAKIRIISENEQIKRHHLSSKEFHHWEKSLLLPYEDETLFSWLYRQSRYFDLSIFEFLKSEILYWNEATNSKLTTHANYITKQLRNADFKLFDPELNTFFERRGLGNFKELFKLPVPSWFNQVDTNNKINDPYEGNALFRKYLVYCPVCWLEKDTRYFRKSWRYTFIIWCKSHNTKLLDKCSNCEKSPFDTNKTYRSEHEWINECSNCNTPLEKNVDALFDENIVKLQYRIIENVFSDKFVKQHLVPDLIFGLEQSSEVLHYFQILSNQKRKSRFLSIVGFEYYKIELVAKFLMKNQLKKKLDFNLLNPGKKKILSRYKIPCFVSGCNKSYNQAHMKRHIISVHTDLRPFECDMKNCDYSGPTKSKLKRHQDEVHIDEKRFPCSFCVHKAKTKDQLTIHELGHENEKNYECDKCDYKVNTPAGLWSHEERHHPSGEIYQCEECSYETQIKPDLAKHINYNHRKEKKFKCEECEYRGKTKYRILEHFESMHSGVRGYPCSECTYAAFTASNLRSHMKYKHPNHKS